MAVNKPPKWQQEIEEILLRSELTSGKPDKEATAMMEDIKEKGRTLDQLKEAWGNPAEWERPQNYLESGQLLQRHFRIWRMARWRALNRYKRTKHSLERDAPSIIIDNGKRMLAEAFSYLCHVTELLSLYLLIGVYKPPKRHWDKYYEWLGTKLKIKDVNPDDAVRFFMSIGTEGKIGFRKRNDSIGIAFYFPKGKEPVGWKGRALWCGAE